MTSLFSTGCLLGKEDPFFGNAVPAAENIARSASSDRRCDNRRSTQLTIHSQSGIMRFIPLFVISVALAAAPLLEAQSAAPAPTPAASPAQTKKHKHKKDLQANSATTTPATAAASPAPNVAPGSSP